MGSEVKDERADGTAVQVEEASADTHLMRVPEVDMVSRTGSGEHGFASGPTDAQPHTTDSAERVPAFGKSIGRKGLARWWSGEEHRQEVVHEVYWVAPWVRWLMTVFVFSVSALTLELTSGRAHLWRAFVTSVVLLRGWLYPG